MVAKFKIEFGSISRFIFYFVLLTVVAMMSTTHAVSLEQTVSKKISARSFPSIFQAWNPADNLPNEDRLTTLARHDLVFHAPEFFGLEWNQQPAGLSRKFTTVSIRHGLEMRRQLSSKNPNLLLLAEIRYRDAHSSYLPANHEWWQRDFNGNLAMGWAEGGYIKLDFANPNFQRQVALQARAAILSGVFDGIMLDWWEDDATRLELIRQVREAIGDRALILVNANDRQTPNTAPYINGYFMECFRSQTPEDWQRIGDTLRWAEQNLQSPQINCVETWFHNSRKDLNLMRAVTTLVLTQSNGYSLFSDPNSLDSSDHLHNWYPFWEKNLSRPLGAGMKLADGSWRRNFKKGTVIYNPMGNLPLEIEFSEAHTSRATGKTSFRHTIEPNDGDIFLTTAKP